MKNIFKTKKGYLLVGIIFLSIFFILISALLPYFYIKADLGYHYLWGYSLCFLLMGYVIGLISGAGINKSEKKDIDIAVCIRDPAFANHLKKISVRREFPLGSRKSEKP